jgi:hypothetical protein
MKLSHFLETLENSVPKIAHLCAIHMLEKNYRLEYDSLNELQLKEFFTNYSLYHKYLNDYAGVIYNKFDSSLDDVYTFLCEYFNENPDNQSLFEYRLVRIANQEPHQYLRIEDSEILNSAITRLENKIQIIENSKYYQNNQTEDRKTIESLKQSLTLVKKAIKMDSC